MKKGKQSTRRGVSEMIAAMIVLLVSLIASVSIYNLAITSFNQYSDDYTYQIETTQQRIEERFTVTSIYKENRNFTDILHYVNNSSSDVDNFQDKGTHSNFINQKLKDGNVDILTEEDFGEIVNFSENFVDNNLSDVDSLEYGSHGNFTAQQYKDNKYDTLTEQNVSGGTQELWVSPSTYDDPSSDWLNDFRAIDGYTDTYAYTYWYNDDGSGWLIGNLGSSLTTSDVRVWMDRSSTRVEMYDVEVYNETNWVRVRTGGTLWGEWDNIGFSEETITKIRVRMRGESYAWYGRCMEIQVLETIESSSYKLDLETQWTTADFDETNAYLCIKTGSMNWSDENLTIDYWSGGSWVNLFPDLNVSTWNNVSISDKLYSGTFTIRYKAGSEDDDIQQDKWDIECSLIRVWSEGDSNYNLDLEVQWTGVDLNQQVEELCIYGEDMGSEDIKVQAWNIDHWETIFDDLNENSWTNQSITNWLDSSTFTIRFKATNEESDTTQDSWEIDAALLNLRSDEGNDFVVYVYNYGMRDIELDKVYIDGEEYSFSPSDLLVSVGDIQQITLDSSAPNSGNLVIVTKRGTSYETYYEP